MLLLDSSQYPVEDRDELIRGMFKDPGSVYFAPADGDDLMKVRFRAWDMGEGCRFLDIQGTGMRFGLRPSRFSSAEAPAIAFSVVRSGSCWFSQGDRREIVPGGGMWINEVNEAFACRAGQGSDAVSLQMPLEVLDLPVRDVRKAAQWLLRSPLYGLARQHLLTLSQYTREFDAPQPSAQQAALHVLRALVKSFSAD